MPVGVVSGIALARRSRPAGVALGAAGVLFTIPSVALFGLLVAPLGLGRPPAVAALALYSLLPVLRNTIVGIAGVPADVVEAGRGMGMTEAQLLRRVRLPLALPVVVSGIRVAAVASVGIATIATLVAAGGLGTTIFAGLAAADQPRVLAATGATVALALAFDAGLGVLERMLRGPRRRRGRAGGPVGSAP